MQVQSVNNNQQSFGVRKVVLDDSLAVLPTRIVRAICEAIDPKKLSELGADTVEFKISAKRKPGMDPRWPNGSKLEIQDIAHAESPDATYTFENPCAEIASPWDIIDAFTGICERICPNETAIVQELLDAARIRAASIPEIIAENARIRREAGRYGDSQ